MDPKEIEGSEARAADRGRAEDLGFVATDKPSLGDPAVTRALMSEFGAGVVSVRGEWLRGKKPDPQSAIRELSREYGAIVMGHDGRYHALPWHDATRLGRRIGLVVPPIDGVTNPGEVLFLTVGTSLMEISAAHEGGRMTDAAAEAATRTMLDDAALLIAGTR